MKLTIRECIIEDLLTLRELSYKTYNDTFSNMNTPSNMKSYLEQAFDISKLREELSNRNSLFYFLYADEELAGYLKLNENIAQTVISDPQSIEIERIYVAKEFHGKGLGSILFKKAIDIASLHGRLSVRLGVWEHNEKALLFYKRNGFYFIGKHSFFMGDDEQTDFIMRKDL